MPERRKKKKIIIIGIISTLWGRTTKLTVAVTKAVDKTAFVKHAVGNYQLAAAVGDRRIFDNTTLIHIIDLRMAVLTKRID